MWNIFRRSLVGTRAKDVPSGAWLNSTSLSSAAKQAAMEHLPLRFDHELSGMVTLIHFWDYSSSDSIDDVSRLHAWWEMYGGSGFTILGIHTPQYEFAKDGDKVEAAMLRFHLDYPVFNDSEYVMWNRYGSKVWPRKILVDHRGIIQFDHSGKGEMESLELKIQELLEQAKTDHHIVPSGDSVTATIHINRDAMSSWGVALSPLTDPAEYHIPNKVPLHTIALSGWWTIGEHELQAGMLTDTQSCVVHFLGVTCVARMRANGQEEAVLQVFLDNKKVGEDIYVREDGEYTLVSNLPLTAHHLALIPVSGSVAIASFSFL